MHAVQNNYGQPVGLPVDDWKPPGAPARIVLEGNYCRLEPLDAVRHAEDLYSAYTRHGDDRLWTYLGYGPFGSVDDYKVWMHEYCLLDDTVTFAIVDRAIGVAAGVAGYLRIVPQSGSIEVGHIVFSPALQRTRVATEAMYLMMRNAFELGYRRYEWKCDTLNEPSRKAALRLGFTF